MVGLIVVSGVHSGSNISGCCRLSLLLSQELAATALLNDPWQ